MVHIGRNVRILGGNRRKPRGPERHRVIESIRLGRRGDVMAPEAAGQLEGIADDPVRALAGKNGGLDRRLVLAAPEPAADSGIFAFGIFANDPEIDVAGLLVAHRTAYARQEPNRAEIDVLVKLTADRDQQAPER